MKLTEQQIADNAAAYVAAMNGKPIIGKVNQQGAVWIPIVSEHIKDYLWEEKWLLRPAPIPEPPKPWDCADDVPGPVCWIRSNKQPSLEMMVVTVWINGLQCMDTSKNAVSMHFREGFENRQYSTDRKEWKPCVKSV